MKKKLLTALIAAALAATALVSCGKQNDTITVVSREDGSGTRGAFTELMGIDINRVIIVTFIIGSFLAAVGSLLYFSSYKSVIPTSGAMPGLKAFVAAVLGGIGSIPGAMIGGFAIGLLEALVAAVGLSVWKDAVVFAILIVVLLVKPSGIMGHPVTEKV